MAFDETAPQAPEGFSEKDVSSSQPDFKPQPTLTKLINLDNHVQDQNYNHTSPKSTQPTSPLRLPTNPALPPITTATTTTPPATLERYISTTATVSANATLTDPLTILFQIDKPTNNLTHSPPPTAESLLPIIYAANLARLQTFIHAETSLIAECSNFATVAVWTPSSHVQTPPSPSFYAKLESEGRHSFADFVRQIEAAKREHLYPVNKRYWHLSMMARDPRREYVSGAVRAVVEPFLAVAEREGVPVWLEAGSARARDIYGHFGFRMVEVMCVAGIQTWCMIKS